MFYCVSLLGSKICFQEIIANSSFIRLLANLTKHIRLLCWNKLYFFPSSNKHISHDCLPQL